MIFGNNPCDFMICIVTSLSVTVLRISTGEIKTFYLFYLFVIKEFNHIHDKGVLQLSPLTFEFFVWREHNGGIN